MYPQSHFLFSLLIALIFVKFGIFDYKIAMLIAIFAVFMDIDHFIVYVLKKHDYSLKDAWNADIKGKYKGRTFIHHYLGFALITTIIIILFFINKNLFWIIGLSYYTHIFLDYTKLNILKIREKTTIKFVNKVEEILEPNLINLRKQLESLRNHKIKKVIEEMLRVARQALILLEWHCFNSKSNPLGVYAGHWMRDYVALLKEFVPERKIQVIKLPEELWSDENWQRYGGVVEVVM